MTAEGKYVPALVETARIVNVNIKDWSVDAVTLHGNKYFPSIQVSSPYLHFNNGEGVYTMPEVGAICWVCKPSEGPRSTPFILGFQAPVDERETDDVPHGEFRVGRQNLNPGDIMMRTRDENFIVLRRGGVIQIGATPVSQRIYIPIGNVIRDMCENYGLFTLGGELTWTVERTETTTTGDAPTQLALKVKQKANEPEHVATLTLGSHDSDDNLVLNLLVKASGDTGAATNVDLKITKEGYVDWTVKKDFLLAAEEGVKIHAKKDLELKSETGAAKLEATVGTLDLVSTAGTTIQSAGPVQIQGSAITLTGPIALAGAVSIGPPAMMSGGGAGSSEPLVKGNELITILTELINIIATTPLPPTPGPSPLASVSTLVPKLSAILASQGDIK